MSNQTTLKQRLDKKKKKIVKKKKTAPRPKKSKSEVELRRQYVELKKAARAQVRAGRAANKQAISFLDKMGELEAATDKLAALLAVKKIGGSNSSSSVFY